MVRSIGFCQDWYLTMWSYVEWSYYLLCSLCLAGLGFLCLGLLWLCCSLGFGRALFLLVILISLVLRWTLLCLVLGAFLILIVSSLGLVLLCYFSCIDHKDLCQKSRTTEVRQACRLKYTPAFQAAICPLPLPSLLVCCLTSANNDISE